MGYFTGHEQQPSRVRNFDIPAFFQVILKEQKQYNFI